MREETGRDPTPADGEEPLESIEVEIRFCVGRLVLSLAQLRRVSAGGLLELDVPADGRVQILANGRCIGRGELVDIDGRLAVEILELSSGT